MAGYLTSAHGSQLTVGDIITLADRMRRMKINRHVPVHVGFINGEFVLAVPAPATKVILPPKPESNNKKPMKAARRGRK